MKKIYPIICSFFALVACTDLSNEFGRIDQKDPNLPAPSPVVIKEVRNFSGGAVIKVEIPDDDNIKGVIATYERRGQMVNAKISRYIDSLTVEGFADTEPHIVKVASFNVNEDQSEAVDVTINPLEPAIRTVKPVLTPTFGGVQVLIEGNTDKSDLAICLLRDEDMSDADKSVSETKWVEVTTLFTASDSIRLKRRGLEPVEAIYGCYVRDRWGNISDTVKTVLTPIVEVQLDKSKFKNALLADDNCFSENESNYPIKALWDGSGASAVPHFLATAKDGPFPCWCTIDLGATVMIDRIGTLPRIDYVIWSGAHPRDFEFWGSMNPTGEVNEDNEHGFDDSWFLLGKFRQFKPSGYTPDGAVGEVTTEDRTYFNAGNDFELDENVCPDCYKPLRYFRVVFVDTFASWELGAKVGQVQFGEVTPWGLYVE